MPSATKRRSVRSAISRPGAPSHKAAGCSLARTLDLNAMGTEKPLPIPIVHEVPTHHFELVLAGQPAGFVVAKLAPRDSKRNGVIQKGTIQ
jgi:hypothetical protein